MALQGACGVFRGAAEVRVVIVGCFFFSSFGVYERMGASKGFWVILRDRRVNFLGTTTSFDSSFFFVIRRHD